MKLSVKNAAAGLLLACAVTTPVLAKKAPAPVILQTAPVDGGRSLHVIVAQSEIKSDINPSNVAAATGGGLLGGLIGAAIDSARAKKAEELIGPIRAAMADVDGDALAIDAAKKSFSDMEWFKANPSDAFGKDSSVAGKSAVLDAAKTKQVALVEYLYDISAEFNAVRVVARIEIANTEIPASFKGKGEKRVRWDKLTYSRNVTSIVLFNKAGKDKEANSALLSADNAAPVRNALQVAFANLVPLTQRTMALTADELTVLNNKKNKRTNAAGYVGRPQPAPNDRTTLLWEGAFINVEAID